MAESRLKPFSVGLWVAASLLLSACASSGVQAGAAVTGGTNSAETEVTSIGRDTSQGPDVAPTTPGELEQLITAFARCVEASFPIVLRFRIDPYTGLTIAVIQQRESEGEAAADVQADCVAKLALDSNIQAYELAHPVSLQAEQEIVAEFVKCAGLVSDRVREILREIPVDTLESVSSVLQALSLGEVDDGLIADQVAVTECMENARYGPERVFAEGHPWFNSP